VQLGDSIALNGACMTVTQFDATASRFTIDISAESLDKTAGLSQPGPVNLEKALRANDRLGGHLVSGHVDGIGSVEFFEPVGESWELRIKAPRELAKYLAFSINLIPHTMENTTLGTLEANHRVNLEIDLIARYVERMLDR
jgi:riboflavin synthase